MNYKTFLCSLALVLLSYCSNSQDIKQLMIKEDSTVSNLSSASLSDLNAFGKFKKVLFAVNSKEIESVPVKNDIATYFDSTGVCWVFTTINSETGIVEFVYIPLKQYYPLSFISDDTLLCRSKEDKTLLYYNLNNNTTSFVKNSIKYLLDKIPDDFNNYFFKVNQSNNKIALKTNYNDKLVHVFIFDGLSVKEVILDADKYFKTWECYDIEWVDKDNLLLYLLRVNRNGNGLDYCQRIFNTRSNSITKITLPPNSYGIEDCINNTCIIRRSDDNSQFIVYKITPEDNRKMFEPLFSVKAENKDNMPIGSIMFISKERIILATDVEAEREVVRLCMNMKEYSYLSFFKIQKIVNE